MNEERKFVLEEASFMKDAQHILTLLAQNDVELIKTIDEKRKECDLDYFFDAMKNLKIMIDTIINKIDCAKLLGKL